MKIDGVPVLVLRIVHERDREDVTDLSAQDRCGNLTVVGPHRLSHLWRDLKLLLLGVEGDRMFRAAGRGLQRWIERLPTVGGRRAEVDRLTGRRGGDARSGDDVV